MYKILTIILLSSLAYSDILKGMSICSSIKIDKERLKCYDNIYKIVSKNGNGKWKISIKKSLIDNSKQVIISKEGSPISTDIGNKRPKLIIRCIKNKLDLYVFWNTYMGSKRQKVTMKFGNEKPYSEIWIPSGDGLSTFYVGDVFKRIKSGEYNAEYNQKDAIKLINKMQKNNFIIIEATPYNKTPVQTKFELNGLNNVINTLNSECKLK